MRTPQASGGHRSIRRMRAARWFVLAGLLALSQAAAAGLVAFEPVLVEGRVLMKAESRGAYKTPVVRPLSGPLGPALAHEARTGTTAFMLQLDAAAQRLAGQEHPQPTFLLVSAEDGGFARRGFWLMRGAGDPEWHADPYVNLAVDADSLEDGSFEEIFAHEAGHVLLRRLLPGLPAGYSRVPHSSLAITDYPTAFDEGFAIHFQALARELTRNSRLRLEDAGFAVKPFVPYWKDALDRTLRIRGVRDNLFVQRQLPWPAHPLAASPDATPALRSRRAQERAADDGLGRRHRHALLSSARPAVTEHGAAAGSGAHQALSRESLRMAQHRDWHDLRRDGGCASGACVRGARASRAGRGCGGVRGKAGPGTQGAHRVRGGGGTRSESLR